MKYLDIKVPNSPILRVVYWLHMKETKFRQITGTKIPVKHYPSDYPLGTEDGQWYTIYPSLPDDDERGQHGRN